MRSRRSHHRRKLAAPMTAAHPIQPVRPGQESDPMNGDYVLMIGSAVLEISARTIAVLQPGIRQTGHIHSSVSGVARNIAENLARLDIETVLLSAVADDDIGQHVITHSSLAGIDCACLARQ